MVSSNLVAGIQGVDDILHEVVRELGHAGTAFKKRPANIRARTELDCGGRGSHGRPQLARSLSSQPFGPIGETREKGVDSRVIAANRWRL
jgi:hypothetical protein